MAAALFIYICLAYGTMQMLVYFDGPFNIIDKFRTIMENISDQFGKLFSCPFCISTWIGAFYSILNQWVIPIDFTPFHLIFGHSVSWWWIILFDTLFTCATTWLWHTIEEMINRVGNDAQEG